MPDNRTPVRYARPMAGFPFDDELPLDVAPVDSFAARRLEHLSSIAGLTDEMVFRLARAYPSLGAVYSASEAELGRVVGPVAAARLRWFLDSPLPCGRGRSSSVGHAA